jgi:hypothetical protein
MTEQDILDRYSTPGLRKNTLSRAAKKQHSNLAMKIVAG